MNRLLSFFLLLALGTGCSQSLSVDQFADTLIINGNIYTVDTLLPGAEAVALRGGRIIDVGSTADLMALRGDSTEVIDLQGRFMMPGFIEGHGHFSGLGYSLINLNFLHTSSWEEIVQMVAEAAAQAEPGEWIVGRGWHQEKWTETPSPSVLGYPYHDALSAVSADNPVMLRHASGHSLFANAKAMELAGVTAETPDPSGGEVVRDSRGKAIGVFEERAMSLINAAYDDYRAGLSEEAKTEEWYRAIELAEEECLKKGVTSFQDAGSKYFELERYEQMAEDGELDLRLWAMVRHSYDEMKDNLDGYPKIDIGNHYFTCRAIKSEVDGALGAFGAWLLRAYNDKKGFTGQNTTPIPEVKNIAQLAMDNDMQMCVHAIGDRANRVVLNIYEEQFSANPEKENLRWRIEHAQHLDTADIPRFREMGIIASMQGIHCTSDAPFVEKRLGRERSRLGAYPWRSLLDEGVIIANGTDAPVEDVDPLLSFYASVTRKRADNGFEFFPEQRMTREEAIHSYTLGNAYAGFEEDFKGSVTKGKAADFVVLSHDLVNCTDEAIPESKVLMTMVDGEVRYQAKDF
ncbi:MAG: amidohydrolase [Phaeodactylibacter xiamenensis]|uniref:Amidohydrolase n=1 Tax=Phaeodactylibacter xiamenensis TaxID=1524460 RepID=A0A098S458_9BACT|nr:amidohydrolase [Phaeodactylibacter xiamenensis]KGE86890.1 amidohydrolase [Phaeodactylibacter xiamenensis]MCR9053204.1 amidohydrolase [bacterium]